MEGRRKTSPPPGGKLLLPQKYIFGYSLIQLICISEIAYLLCTQYCYVLLLCNQEISQLQ